MRVCLPAVGMKWSNCHCERNEMERGNRSVAELNEVNLYCAAINMRLLRSCLPACRQAGLAMTRFGRTSHILSLVSRLSFFYDITSGPDS